MPRLKPTELDKHIGQNIRQLRRAYGLSMRELGSAVGVSGQQIQKYETARNKIPASLLSELAYQLHLPVESILMPPVDFDLDTQLDEIGGPHNRKWLEHLHFSNLEFY